MKKLIVKILFLTAVILMPVSAMARVSVHINIPLPPPIIFPAPPELVVIPETNVYAVPDMQEEMFFSAGWWWRPWEGRWYRSRYHDRGWAYYKGVPSFHGNVPPGWRDNYRDKQWKGHPWQQQRIHQRDVQRNWRGWEINKHWERQNSWGVQGLPTKQHPQRATKNNPRQQRDGRPQPGHGPEHGPGPGPGPIHPR
jgi:hypothetical protein